MYRSTPPPTSSSIVYVGQLPYEWSEEAVHSAVCGTGDVVEVRMGMDNPHKNKGFCFVEYANPAEAHKAISLLNAMRIEGKKNLRTELSKEGTRERMSGQSQKPILKLNRNALPHNLILPQEMLNDGIPLPNRSANGYAAPNMGAPYNQNAQMYNTNTFGSGPNFNGNRFNSSGPNNYTSNQMSAMPFSNPAMAPTAANQFSAPPPIPASLTNAFQVLPQQGGHTFDKEDKVSENLSTIPPAMLVQLIAQLKSLLIGPNAASAAQIFTAYPHLAVSAAQALLSMGLIDLDVISEAALTSSVEAAATGRSPVLAVSVPGQTDIPALSQDPVTVQAPAPAPQVAVNSKWPNLPSSVADKLTALDPSQAELIAQVLSFTPQQIEAMAPDQKAMVQNIHSQYY
ncbi:hypothetical protein BABINDRAFT_8662 [Babjeviella inositovora NRRL Y-12698]|uniref:RRM domain-containing protein n=1 Tax=Babjeviella inositovora NRRL Y-12698 TaxID=984486 RepID=A0A1E3QN44_9ASCO|nr:uncharacterized protein BABINDRAFT_8662 [Babjeviella inositovora NRRL Y-12698]ODQ79050.1 hypothetical protein BABINDRAFT_8662 [Babjeviella inositovora NRRL Y-12698]